MSDRANDFANLVDTLGDMISLAKAYGLDAGLALLAESDARWTPADTVAAAAREAIAHQADPAERAQRLLASAEPVHRACDDPLPEGIRAVLAYAYECPECGMTASRATVAGAQAEGRAHRTWVHDGLREKMAERETGPCDGCGRGSDRCECEADA